MAQAIKVLVSCPNCGDWPDVVFNLEPKNIKCPYCGDDAKIEKV